jgi:hypothetical protein
MTEIQVPNLLEAYQQGHEMRRTHDMQKARDGILAQYGTDPDKAAGLLMQSGDFDGAREMQNYSANSADHRMRKETHQREVQAAVMGQMRDMAKGVRLVPAEQRLHAFDTTIAPAMQQMGMDQQTIARFRAGDMSDRGLDMLISSLGGEIQKLQVVQRGGGGYDVINPNTGEVTRSVEPMQPKPPAGYAWGQDGGLVAIPGGPADPKVVNTLTDTRAGAVARHRRPLKGSASGGSSSLPPGFELDE